MTSDNRKGTVTQRPMSRRTALAVLGATGISLTGGAKAALAQNAHQPAPEVSRRFSNVNAMKSAGTLEAGMIVQTVGFHSPDDGGGAFYLIGAANVDEKTNEGDVIAISESLHATLIEGRAVNYAMFGAVGDGKNDDGVQIKKWRTNMPANTTCPSSI